jgi:hypothetical protein
MESHQKLVFGAPIAGKQTSKNGEKNSQSIDAIDRIAVIPSTSL